MNMMDMCKNMTMEECREMMQKMMNQEPDVANFEKKSQEESLATEEIRTLFFIWLQQIEEEIEQFIKENGIDVGAVAQAFKITEESARYLLSRVTK